MTRHRARRAAFVVLITVIAVAAGIGVSAVPDARAQAITIVALFLFWGAYKIPTTYKARAPYAEAEAAEGRRFQLAALAVIVAGAAAAALLNLDGGAGVLFICPIIAASAGIEMTGDARWSRYLDRRRIVEVLPGIPGASMTTMELEKATGLSRRRVYRATTDLYFAGVITLPVGHAGYQLVDIKE